MQNDTKREITRGKRKFNAAIAIKKVTKMMRCTAGLTFLTATGRLGMVSVLRTISSGVMLRRR